MLKNILFATGAAIAIIASASLPASATGGLPQSSDPQSVPEPMTVLGSLAVGGGFVAKKIADSRKNKA